MFKPELWQSHSEYRTFITAFRRRLSRNNPKYHFDSYEKEYQKLLELDLDPAMEFMSSFYSSGGRPAKNQAQILRSFVLFVLRFNTTNAKTSLTSWVRDVLPNSPVLTGLIGCESAEDLPPLGSYYDFMNRFWLASRTKYSRIATLPAGKNGRKPKKEIGPDGKLVEPDEPIPDTSDIVSNIMNGLPAKDNPESALQHIFFLVAVLPSINLGLIDRENLTMSGDGTAVVSHSSPYGKRPASCPASCAFRKDCDSRHYSDPDADWGLDSSNRTWYFGFTLYLLCCRNDELKIELPLLANFTSARRHDSKNFLYAIDDFGRNTYGIFPKNICLDSAHDNMPTYRLLDHWGINALIDINSRSQKSDSAPDDITFNKDGHPVCRDGHEMCSWGNDSKKNARKYRCPYRCGRVISCPYIAQCSPTKYGRTVYVKNDEDLRFHPHIPRDSDEFKDIYRQRTACERINDRVLNNYCLQHLKIRGKDHFSFWTMLICICIHLDARYKVASQGLV